MDFDKNIKKNNLPFQLIKNTTEQSKISNGFHGNILKVLVEIRIDTGKNLIVYISEQNLLGL